MRRYRFSAILACWLFSLFSLGASASPSVAFETTLGSFTVELNSEQAPVTVKNFLRYVEDGSYVGSIFHRVIPGFMVQGGGFSTQMERLKTYPPIANEASNGLLNQTGTIAMARTQDPNSATRQFFINLVDNDFLNYGERPPGYAVFGRVTSGIDVIQKIGQQKTGVRNYMKDVPVEPIIITRVFVVPEKDTTATTPPAQ
ncbi:Peptidyl-prolyl cis-trans isomerase A precursor [Vibrio ruber DSM 16370]|uniref:Peptidyl-prolyl cis-trans isomerase n=1 Tax=Vibrio ruber (strain DSM 16370 / JCM 11486 / BCRC 17186 / CECT 7878 / LMG 23124 / VR1) TaxID=1123498 RepID=A0A1R4LIH1_VIBR1|nr:peptidylprolyl isomerase [Vibrio ruber]SJN56127.1 Peptidyl-prolyl cis-trans isomerase A precursor [Vibrio ruber DSM 16370]